ncbi:MAG: tetratricopeptide repeat protein [Bacteroidetes bacterium]|nr:MAG: tetratricopeptide repeat protein [Bacteroidota bacterium]
MKILHKILFVSGILLLHLLSDAQEQNYYELFEQANELYKQEKYQEALEKYQAITAADFASAELYYNIGNAYFKLNKIPHAILFYEKALKLKPNDSDIKFNLEIARKQTVDKINAIPPLITTQIYNAVLNLFSSDGWAWLSILCAFAAAVLFMIYYAKKIQPLLLVSTVVLAFSLLFVYFSVEQKNRILHSGEAIVFTPTVTVKSEPKLNSTDLFVIHSGLKVKILEEHEDWSKIALEDGNVGWIKNTDYQEI